MAPWVLALLLLAGAPPSGSTDKPAPASGDASRPSPGSAPVSRADEQVEEEDRKLADRLVARGGGVQSDTEYLLGMAWSPVESAPMHEAALRRLRTTEPRIVAGTLRPLLETASPEAQIGMLDLMSELYRRIGGVDFNLNGALADRIRSPYPRVASEAITVCTTLGIKESYLPLREIASRADSPLRDEAIQGIARLRDPRAVSLFEQLLKDGSAPRDELYRGMAQLGRPAALFLKSKLDDPDPEERRRAIEALLPISATEDLTSFYTYIHKYPPEAELKKRLYERIATLEASQFERSPDD